jgi:hypothetical protein
MARVFWFFFSKKNSAKRHLSNNALHAMVEPSCIPYGGMLIMHNDMPRRAVAEFFGTFWLTFAGCGSAVLAAARDDAVDV